MPVEGDLKICIVMHCDSSNIDSNQHGPLPPGLFSRHPMSKHFNHCNRHVHACQQCHDLSRRVRVENGGITAQGQVQPRFVSLCLEESGVWRRDVPSPISKHFIHCRDFGDSVPTDHASCSAPSRFSMEVLLINNLLSRCNIFGPKVLEAAKTKIITQIL